MHPVIIHCPRTVSLPAHAFTAQGTSSSTRRRATLTRGATLTRMQLPPVIAARRELTRSTPAPRPVLECPPDAVTASWPSALASLALIAAIVVLCALATHAVRF